AVLCGIVVMDEQIWAEVSVKFPLYHHRTNSKMLKNAGMNWNSLDKLIYLSFQSFIRIIESFYNLNYYACRERLYITSHVFAIIRGSTSLMVHILRCLF
ncbi:hypothetical protein ACJX0J_019497, partial [Zea mays]